MQHLTSSVQHLTSSVQHLTSSEQHHGISNMASRLSMLQKDAQLAVENKLSSATTLSWSFQRFCNISLMLKLKRSRQAGLTKSNIEHLGSRPFI
jgi:hypothetical protein